MSFSEHLSGVLQRMEDDAARPARSLPRSRRESPYRGHGPAEADHKAAALVSGEGFEFLGRTLRLRLTSVGPAAAFTRDGFGRWLVLRHGEGVKAITGLYAREGIAWLTSDDESGPARMSQHEQRLGLAGVRYESRDLGERPGRCYPSRHLIVLHWALFALGPALIDYVAASQLAHIAASSTKRDSAWWRQMERFYPASAGDMEDQLTRAWAGIWTGTVTEGQQL